MSKYTLKFLPEYFATSLWSVSQNAYDDFGVSIPYEKLNLSEDLIYQLKKFDDSIITILNWSDPTNNSPLSYEEQEKIYQNGLRLFKLVCKELGEEYEVINSLEWIKPTKKN